MGLSFKSAWWCRLDLKLSLGVVYCSVDPTGKHLPLHWVHSVFRGSEPLLFDALRRLDPDYGTTGWRERGSVGPMFGTDTVRLLSYDYSLIPDWEYIYCTKIQVSPCTVILLDTSRRERSAVSLQCRWGFIKLPTHSAKNYPSTFLENRELIISRTTGSFFQDASVTLTTAMRLTNVPVFRYEGIVVVPGIHPALLTSQPVNLNQSVSQSQAPMKGWHITLWILLLNTQHSHPHLAFPPWWSQSLLCCQMSVVFLMMYGVKMSPYFKKL